MCLGINALWYSLYTGLGLFASLPPRGSPSLGLLETPQLSTWELLKFTSTSMEGREAGSHGELNAGHMDQTKIQWAVGEVAAVFACQSTVPPQQRPDLPSSPSPLVCFLNTSVEQERTKPVGTMVPC